MNYPNFLGEFMFVDNCKPQQCFVIIKTYDIWGKNWTKKNNLTEIDTKYWRIISWFSSICRKNYIKNIEFI